MTVQSFTSGLIKHGEILGQENVKNDLINQVHTGPQLTVCIK